MRPALDDRPWYQLTTHFFRGLFDFGSDEGDTHGASTQEPALIAADTWSIKERLTLEKAWFRPVER